MSSAHRSKLYIIFLTVFIDLVGFGILIPVLPLYAKHFGATPAINGWLVGIYSAVQLFSAPWLGRLSDRVGRRPVLLVSLLGTAIGFFIMGWAKTLTLLFVGRIIDGFSGGNISTAQAYIADITAPEERSKAMGLLGAAIGLGFVFGPTVGGILGHISVSAPFYFAGVLAVFNAVLVYFLLPESLPKEARAQAHERPSFVEVLRHGQHLPLLVGSYFFSIAGFSIMTANYALFTSERFGFDQTSNGYLFAFVGILGVIIQGGFLRHALKRGNERGLALVGGGFLMLGLLLLPLGHGLLMLILSTGIIGIGNSLMTPTLNGLASRNADNRWQGSVIGLMQAAGSLARCLGPILGGWLLMKDSVQDYGRAPFWAGAVLIAIAAFCIARLPRPSPAPARAAVEA